MSTPIDPRREHPSTYFVQNRSNEEELTRLQLQDQMITTGMGGVLPEQADPALFHRVLDVGCGTGGWLIEAAKTYPGMSMLVGVDVSDKMIEHARTQAKAAQVSDRVEFRAMDALRMLEFPANYFDLVNQRFAQGWMRRFEWPKLLGEYQRVTRPGGIIRLTETDAWEGNSLALSRLTDISVKAAYQAGYLFRESRDGLTSELAHLLYQYGIQHVQTRTYILEFRAGTPEGHLFSEIIRLGYRTGSPFLKKWTQVPDDYEAICQQMLSEMQQPDFVATMGLLTAWGRKPSRKETPGVASFDKHP
jgi:ubiquinone/menaquinone biosynthesis C-methylase UbiE